MILDERGHVAASKLVSKLLFDVISTAHERTSMIAATALPCEQWTDTRQSDPAVDVA
jgi:hypothetical protein